MNLFNKRKALMLYAEKKKEGGEPIYLPYLQSDGQSFITEVIELNKRISSKQVYNNDGNLIHNYRPCLNPNNLKPGVYDTITKTYLYNQGKGEFTYGAPLVKLDYIQSDADAYINTEYKATELTGIKVLWSSDEIQTSGAIFGSFNTISPKLNDRFQVVFATGDKTYVGYGTGNTILQTSKYCDGKVHSLEINPLTKQIIADGEVVGNNIQAGDLVKRKSQKLCLFTTNQGTIRQRSTIKIHEVIITEDGMEKMHLIPYRMNSGELGMWDILAGKSYGNVSGGGNSKFNSLIDGKEMVKDIYALWGQGWFTTNIYPDEDAEIYMTYKYRGGLPAGSAKIFSSDKTWVGPYPERDAQMSFQYGTQLGHTEGLFVDTAYIYHVAVRGNEFEIAIDETQEHETQGGKYEKITLNKETFKSKKPLLIGKVSNDTNIYSFTYINRKTKEFYQYIPVPTGKYTGSLYSVREKYVLSQDGTTDFQIDR